jgi:hypothetical protein
MLRDRLARHGGLGAERRDRLRSAGGEPREQPQPQGCYTYDERKNKVCTVPCPPNAQPGGVCTP